MVQFSLSYHGKFILVIAGITLFLFWLSERTKVISPVPGIISLRSLLKESILAAEISGQAIQLVKNANQLNIRNKAGLINGKTKEITSNADLVSQKCIKDKLLSISSDLFIRSEEKETPNHSLNAIIDQAKLTPIATKLDGQQYVDVFMEAALITIWVDPLDATQEFSENLTEYVSVLMCAVVGERIAFGLVHFVFSNTTYWAWSIGSMHTNLLSSNNPSTILRVLISRSHGSPENTKLIKSIFNGTDVDIIPVGGTGYKLLQLAEKKADVYIHPSGARRWDLCGPQMVLQAAGGVLRTMTGLPFTYRKQDPDLIDSSLGIFATSTKDLYDKYAPLVKQMHLLFGKKL